MHTAFRAQVLPASARTAEMATEWSTTGVTSAATPTATTATAALQPAEPAWADME